MPEGGKFVSGFWKKVFMATQLVSMQCAMKFSRSFVFLYIAALDCCVFCRKCVQKLIVH